jgi:hypothetical protein
VRYSARWQEHGCAGLSSFEVYTSESDPGADPVRLLCRLLFSSPKHRYDRRSCCSISIARARHALTQHTHRRATLGTRLNLSYAAAGIAGSADVRDGRLRDYEVRVALQRMASFCCLANMRIVAHFTGVNGSSRAGDASSTMNTIKRSSHLPCMPCVTSSTVVTCEVQMQTISP